MILELLAKGATEEEILQDYPQLEADYLRAALLYAHHKVSHIAVSYVWKTSNALRE